MQESGYTSLRPVQEKCIPLLLSERQVMVQAETGSGKTAAYLIPALSRTNAESPFTQILILAPTRELAVQIHRTAEQFAAYTRIHCIALIGGIDIRRQMNALRNSPHVLIGTPGRILDLIRSSAVDLSHLRLTVLDEADQVISTGQRQETMEILANCSCGMALFSATLTEEVRSFMTGDFTEVVLHRAEVSSRIAQYFIPCEDRRRALLHLLAHTDISSAIIFVSHRSSAAELSHLLQKEGILSRPFSSDYAEKQRLAVLEKFRRGEIRILVATDAAARGLDLPQVSHIIHYDLPSDTQTFIHRTGRTGHQGGNGIAVTLLDDRGKCSRIGRILTSSCETFVPDPSFHADLSVPLSHQEEKKPDVIRILIRAGRKDKLRPKDLIGALCTVLPFEKIGTIEIQDRFSTAVLLTSDTAILERLAHLSIKGKPRKIEQTGSGRRR